MKKKSPTSVVTGAAGFLGSHLTDLLLSRGHKVIGLDNFVTGSADNIAHLGGHKNFKFIQQDVTEFIFLDCPPGLSSLAENIFQAADIVLMPVIPTTLSIRTYHMVKSFFKDKDIEGSKMMCFFSMVDLRKNMHNDFMEELYRDKRFFENYIPYLSDVEKMGVNQAPVETFARNSYAARCYSDLWDEIKEGVL